MEESTPSGKQDSNGLAVEPVQGKRQLLHCTTPAVLTSARTHDTLCILAPPPCGSVASTVATGFMPLLESARPCLDNGPLSPDALSHASIATRVKQGLGSRGSQRLTKVAGKRVTPKPEADFSDPNGSQSIAANGTVNGRTRNRIPPKRFDLANQDLELALQRVCSMSFVEITN